jgi:hypothetical protein
MADAPECRDREKREMALPACGPDFSSWYVQADPEFEL